LLPKKGSECHKIDAKVSAPMRAPMERDAMTVHLPILLISVGLLSAIDAQAAPTQGRSDAPAPAATRLPPAMVQLAGSFQNSTAKLADKYLAGRAGGRYGIGGTESVVFKKKKSK
jgi:hypothetical protein